MRYFVSCSYLNLTYEILSYYDSYQYILFYSNVIILKIVFLTQLICEMKYEKLCFRQPRILDAIHFLIIIKNINCMQFGVIFLEWSLRGFSVCNSSSCLVETRCSLFTFTLLRYVFGLEWQNCSHSVIASYFLFLFVFIYLLCFNMEDYNLNRKMLFYDSFSL